VFGFLGPNGAGKTTTVRLLATLLQPTSGTAEVAGIPLSEENAVEIRRRIAVLPEVPGLYARLSVEVNLLFHARLRGCSGPRASRTVRDALGGVGLADRRAERAGTLSKGLLQRAAIARALLGSPEIVFLDEPTSGLDPRASQDARALVTELKTRGM